MSDSSLEPTAAAIAALLQQAHRVTALTGAGISTAAGIPDFRGPNGLYTTGAYDAERVFDCRYFEDHPELLSAFSRDLLRLIGSLHPCYTHRFLAALERAGTDVTVITQNIDPLHQMAGSRCVYPVHGSYAEAYCVRCGCRWPTAEYAAMLEEASVPRCRCGGVVRPDIVLFGEAVQHMPEAQAAVARCDVLLVLGTSLTVYPAAALPSLANGPVVVVNRGETGYLPRREDLCVDALLDPLFTMVAAHLGLGVQD